MEGGEGLWWSSRNVVGQGERDISSACPVMESTARCVGTGSSARNIC